MALTDLFSNVSLVVRWLHVIAGITWIGLLYFFNFVNVPLQGALDDAGKKAVNPKLMPRALWWFRWGAVVTVLAGWIYWVLLLHREPQPPDGEPGQYVLRTLGYWFLIVIAAWVIFYLLLRVPPGAKETPLTKNGYLFAVPVVFLAVVMMWMLVDFITYKGASNRVLAIAVGGGYGLALLGAILLLAAGVWWAWASDGTRLEPKPAAWRALASAGWLCFVGGVLWQLVGYALIGVGTW